ncbi:MAG: response regulator [Dehalococcoidia bacterium]|nr:response regulator [Dehalococcoidia bacterium]
MVCQKPSVLIVDDEQVVCNLLYSELSERGYLCTTAFNGHSALTKLATQGFDVVLLDINLPGVSGMEVLSKLRSEHPNTAAIMITVINDVDTAVEAIKLGAADYIVKPFDLDKVNASIRTVSETHRGLPERRDSEAPLYLGSEEEAKQAMEESFSRMNAIARGVEAKYELLTGYSNTLTQRTVKIARQLGIPEKEIQKWADARARLESERNGEITSLLGKLERSPLAQSLMGMTVSHRYQPNPGESQN